MQAAITAKRRGHNVTLVEKSSELGGQLNIASVPPNKYPINLATKWLSEEIKRQNVDVKLNYTATVENIEKLNPDVIIAATGSVPATPPIEGAENTIQSWDLLDGSVKLPQNSNIAIVGGGVVACETALMLAKEGNNKVSVIEMLDNLANGLESTHLEDLHHDFAKYEIGAITGAQVIRIYPDSVVYEHAGENKTFDCDTIILSTGQKPFGTELISELKSKGFNVITVGDAIKPGKIMGSIRSGNFAAYSL